MAKIRSKKKTNQMKWWRRNTGWEWQGKASLRRLYLKQSVKSEEGQAESQRRKETSKCKAPGVQKSIVESSRIVRNQGWRGRTRQ
jgi:hypothetical protein